MYCLMDQTNVKIHLNTVRHYPLPIPVDQLLEMHLSFVQHHHHLHILITGLPPLSSTNDSNIVLVVVATP
jgi:hypothetical protein